MANALLSRRVQIARKIEAVEGVAEALVAVDVKDILVGEPTIDFDFSQFNRDAAQAPLSKRPSCTGTKLATISYKVEVRGSGSAAGAKTPPFGEILRSAGLGETVNGTTDTTYVPISVQSDIPSQTMAFFNDGIRYLIRGARATIKLVHTLGEPIMLEIEFKGVYVDTIDAALLSPVSLDDLIPAKFLDANLAVDDGSGAFTPIFGKLDIDFGNTLTPREDANDPSGYLSIIITKRDMVGEFDPELALIATHDYMGNLEDDTLITFTETIGDTAGNIMDITAPAIQYRDLSQNDKDGLAAQTIALQFNQSAFGVEDEIQIVFT